MSGTRTRSDHENRNHAGPESLEAVIRAETQVSSLPVFTIADIKRLNRSRAYAELIEKYGTMVQSGPFAGMRYSDRSVDHLVVPRLVGSYE